MNKVISSLKYNNNHQQISSTDALGNTTQFAYDKAGRLISTISPTGSKVEKKYDTTGNVISERDGNGNITLFTYDEFGRLISVTLPNDEITSYTYDLNGNMLTQTDARGITTTFEYNVANLRTKIIDHGGKILVDGKYVYDQSKIQSFTYTSNGLKATHTNKSGTVVSYAYDVHDRVLSKTASNKNGVQTVTYTYDKNNNLLTITDESGTITRTYDEFNRVLTKTVPKIGKTTYEYDKTESVQSGEVAEKAFYPNAQAVTKIYDKAGRLSKVVASEDTVKYNYYDNGSVKSVVYGNGAKEEYSYTPNNNLQTLTNKKTDGTIINSYSYTYDANANILSKTDEMGTTSYTYDSLDLCQYFGHKKLNIFSLHDINT